MSLVCPHCGGVIVALLGASSDASSDASGAMRQEAQEVLGSDLDPAPNGARAYNQGYPVDFELWWKVYPSRKDKRKAFKAWRNALRRVTLSTGASAAEAQALLLAGAMRYRDDPNRRDEYTKYAEGWLNGDRWLDDPLPARSIPGQRPDPPRPLIGAEGMDEIRRARHGE